MGYRIFKLRKAHRETITKADFDLKATVTTDGRIISLRSADGHEMIRAGAENAFGALLFAKRNDEYLPLLLRNAKAETHDGPASRRSKSCVKAHR
jgi:hypothetical protein